MSKGLVDRDRGLCCDGNLPGNIMYCNDCKPVSLSMCYRLEKVIGSFKDDEGIAGNIRLLRSAFYRSETDIEETLQQCACHPKALY